MMPFFMAGGGDALTDAIPDPEWQCSELAGLVILNFDPLLVYSELDSKPEIGRALGVAETPTETVYAPGIIIGDGVPDYETGLTAFQAEQYTWFIRLTDVGGFSGLNTEWETFPVVDPGCGEASGGGGGGGGGGHDGGIEME